MLITKLYESERVRFGSAGPLILMQYKSTPTLDEVRLVERFEDELLKQYPKISVFNVVEQTGAILRVPDDVRDYSAKLSDKFASRIVGSAMVVTAKGLGAVMARTFLSGFFLLSRAELLIRSFSTVPEGLTWLRALPDQHVSLKTELTLADLERFFGEPIVARAS